MRPLRQRSTDDDRGDALTGDKLRRPQDWIHLGNRSGSRAHDLPACEGVTVRRYLWQDQFDPDDIDLEIVYPKSASAAPIGLPPTIQQEFDAALRVRSVSPNAYGVLLGRLLELVCNDRGAEKGNLDARLKELSSRDEIPEKLVRVAEKLQELRHVGAHARVGELGSAEVPILDSLCRAILEYVYSAPHLVQQAEERLNQLRSQQRKKKRVKKAPKPESGA